jgi:hypothetical protein
VNSEAGGACPNRHDLLRILAAPRYKAIGKAPVPLIVNESMTGGVACVIKDNRALLVRVRPDSSTALLQEQTKGFRRAQQDRDLDRRKIEALTH